MSFLSFFVPLALLLCLVALIRAVWRYRSEPPLLPTNGRQYSGYTEPRPSHSPVETRNTVPRSILCSTSNREVRALPSAAVTQPQQCSTKSLPPPLPPRPLSPLTSAAQKPRPPNSVSKNELFGILVEQSHRPVNKVPQTAQVVIVQPCVKPPEPVYQSGVAPPLPARKPREYFFSGDGIPGPSVGGVLGTATKALVEPSVPVKPLQPVDQPQPEPLERQSPQPLQSPGSQDEDCIANKDNDEDSDDGIDLQKQGLDHLALRELSKQEWENMTKCRKEERSARKCGQLLRARELADKSEQHKRCMQILNDQAAEVIFSKKNKDPTFRRIDLHGLRVGEAIDHTKRAIKRAHELGNSEMRIIVGKGIHSKDGQAKVKPAILALLQNHYQFSVKIDPSNTGALDVKLDSALSF